MNRAELARAATALLDESTFRQALAEGKNDIDQRSVIVLRQWAQLGAQSVEMPHTYAAALMATDAHEALEGQPLPWPAFEVQVPAGLLSSSHGPITSVLVAELAKDTVIIGRAATSRLCVAYFDPVGVGLNAHQNLLGMFDPLFFDNVQSHVDPALADLFDESIEKRLWAMIARLVGGVVLAIAEARERTPELYGPRPLRTKHGVLKPTTHAVGHPLTIDCRAHIRDFVLGLRRSEPRVQTLVRGHWRHQPYGPRAEQKRRVQWITPHFRGEGALVSRPVRLREPE